MLGFYVVIRINPSDPKFVKALVTLGSFGGAFGASVHAILLKQRIIGSILLVTSIIVFVASLMIPIPVPQPTKDDELLLLGSPEVPSVTTPRSLEIGPTYKRVERD
jgi:hypothetical protein